MGIFIGKRSIILHVDIKSGKKKIIAEGVSDDKITYTKGILRYVDADGEIQKYLDADRKQNHSANTFAIT